MSTRQTGNRYELAVCEMAEALGYAAFKARGSRGCVDVVCFKAEHSPGRCIPLRPLAIQVGTANKAIAATLRDLDAAPRPIGSRCIVARRKLTKSRRVVWSFHTQAGTFATLAEAIA